MEERNERIDYLAGRWLTACATDDEERELRDLLRQGPLPESLRDFGMLFEGFEALAEECAPARSSDGDPVGFRTGGLAAGPSAPADIGTAAGGSTGAEGTDGPCRSRRRGRIGRPIGSRPEVWRLAAAALIAVGVFLCVSLLNRPLCYINGQAIYDRELAMQSTVYFDSFASLEATSQIVEELLENEDR